jgi:hypothetical protein
MAMMIKRAALAFLRHAAWCLLAWVCLFAFAVAAKAQPFSAEMVARRDGVPAHVGRLSVRDSKVRIETAELADGFFLTDVAKPSAYFVRPAARLYMDARQSSRLALLFVPVDPDAPCTQWQAMARLAGSAGPSDWRCERIGEETIDGRNTVVFHTRTTAGQEMTGWIDRERKFPLQIRTEDGALIALEAIREQPQAAASFEIPAMYHKFSPEALIERIKQSDVWVAGPDDAEPPHR